MTRKRRRRARQNGLRGVTRSIEVGAKAPLLLNLGVGLSRQVQAQAASPSAANITGAVQTGVLGVVGVKTLDVALKKVRRR